MAGTNGKIKTLCKNYDAMTDEGKNELLKMGENFLAEIKLLGDKEIVHENDGLKFSDEKSI
jgi:ribosomal protein S20